MHLHVHFTPAQYVPVYRHLPADAPTHSRWLKVVTKQSCICHECPHTQHDVPRTFMIPDIPKTRNSLQWLGASVVPHDVFGPMIVTLRVFDRGGRDMGDCKMLQLAVVSGGSHRQAFPMCHGHVEQVALLEGHAADRFSVV